MPFPKRSEKQLQRFLSPSFVFSAAKSLCLITMLIELNCFFTLLCWVCSEIFFISVGVDVQAILFSAKNFIIFYGAHTHGVVVCTPTLNIANLSSFHKSKLWIYQFFRSRFARFTLRRCGMLISALAGFTSLSTGWLSSCWWNLFRNWGWQAFNGKFILAEKADGISTKISYF